MMDRTAACSIVARMRILQYAEEDSSLALSIALTVAISLAKERFGSAEAFEVLTLVLDEVGALERVAAFNEQFGGPLKLDGRANRA